jgi:hypothetical protein
MGRHKHERWISDRRVVDCAFLVLGLELRQIVPKKITNPKNLAGQQTAATPILLFSLSYMPRCVFFPPFSTPTHFPTLVDDLFSRLAVGGCCCWMAAVGSCRRKLWMVIWRHSFVAIWYIGLASFYDILTGLNGKMLSVFSSPVSLYVFLKSYIYPISTRQNQNQFSRRCRCGGRSYFLDIQI